MEFFDETNTIIEIGNWELLEQEQAQTHIPPEAVVLELGARYGLVSCFISKQLSNSLNLVSVEPDDTVWDALENNMLRNNCNFNIVKGTISNNKLSVNKSNLTTYNNNSSVIPNYTLDDIQRQYNLTFDTLIGDCEGCLQQFFEENPILYDQLNLIIIEHDKSDKTDYTILMDTLRTNNFVEIESRNNEITRSVWKKQFGGKKSWD
jgi:FkbM family methyltransferase